MLDARPGARQSGDCFWSKHAHLVASAGGWFLLECASHSYLEWSPMQRPTTNQPQPQAEPLPAPTSSLLKRSLMAALGIVMVGVAGIGVFLPGIPTVGPLILASLFLTKSSPRLERRLIRNRFFARYLPYLDGTSEMSFKARVIAILLMWVSISLSCLLLGYFENGFGWLAWSVILAGVIGTIFILRFGKSNGGNNGAVDLPGDSDSEGE